jgi:hypothetical protein
MQLSTPTWSGRFIHLHRVRHPADIRQASAAPRVFFPAPALAHRLGRLYFRQNPTGAVPAHIVDDILFGVVEAVADPSRHRMTSLFVISSPETIKFLRVIQKRHILVQVKAAMMMKPPA